MSNIDAREGGTVNFIQGDQISATHINYGASVSVIADELERRISSGIADALSGIRFVYDAASKVKDDQVEIRRVATLLEHIIVSLEDRKQRDLDQPQQYTDALIAITNLTERSQRILQRLLKRTLGDQTWNRNEIAKDIMRLNEDVQNYMSVHTIQTLDTMHAVNTPQPMAMPYGAEKIMAKLGEIDILLRTLPGDEWSSAITSEIAQDMKSDRLTPITQGLLVHGSSRPELVHSLAAAGRTSVTITGLRLGDSDAPDQTITINDVTANANLKDILKEIGDMGYCVPDDLHENELLITVTADVSEFDATAPGGLQIARTTPLIHWWNKYSAYHGLSPASTPRHTIATLDHTGKTIAAARVNFKLYRTLRVPDSVENELPPNLGQFPLFPVSRFAHRLPENVRKKGGFIMPMFQREALWISFVTHRNIKAAVKVSVGEVNAISGAAKDGPAPLSIDQDYVVAGLQPWLDGIMTESGVVRQFVAMPFGQGYTVEEQVTGKAEHGGLQFDIFPLRPTPPGTFKGIGPSGHEQSFLFYMTPEELSIPDGAQICFYPNIKGIQGVREARWTLSGYYQRTRLFAPIAAHYSPRHVLERYPRGRNALVDAALSVSARGSGASLLGLAAGGRIKQKVYRDTLHPRVYDEENGHRFYVHILSSESWEAVTGVLPPITPITPSTYKTHGISWYSLYDERAPSLTTSSSILQQVQSVTQLDDAHTSSSMDLIDPNNATCSKHPRTGASCVFRPCAHLACAACLGQTLMRKSRCQKCGAAVTKFVGVKDPVPQVTSVGDDEVEGTESWNIAEIEQLAQEAVDLKNIVIIHLPEDRVSPLYAKPTEATRTTRI